MNFETLARACFWICVLVLVVLSVVPGEIRPHTGASGHFEHFIAYAGTGLFAAPGSPRWRVGALIGLSLLSGAAEIAQIWIPERTAEFWGFFYSTLGAAVGLALGALAWTVWTRRDRKAA
jgi:VanZ family protein